MHLDSLPKTLVTYLRSNAALQPLTKAVEEELLLVTVALHTGDPVVAGLWFDNFVSQHHLDLPNLGEVRQHFEAAARGFRPVYETAEEDPVEPLTQAQRLEGETFRPEYISEAGTPIYNEQVREFMARFDGLPEGTRQRILYEHTLAHRPDFDRADDMKPASLQPYRGVIHGIESLKQILSQARSAQEGFQVALNGYSINLRNRSPSDHFYEAMEPDVQAWGDLLEEALAKFKQVDLWQEHSGTSEQKKQLSELWLKEFTVLRESWKAHQGDEGLTALLATLHRLSKQDRLLDAPGVDKKRKP